MGLLAEISTLLGGAKINIESVSVFTAGSKAILTFLVDDEAKARRILHASGYKTLTSESLTIRLQDEPGTLSKVSSIIARAGISINALHIVAREGGCTVLAITTDKPKAAKKLLSKYIMLEN